jgi:hypothetical protein
VIADVVQRLKDAGIGLKTVEGIIDFASLTAPPPDARLPAVYVTEVSEGFVPASGMSGAKSQQGSTTIGCILCLSAARRDVTAAPDALETMRTALKDALFGWAPPGFDGAEFAHAGGKLLLSQGYLVVWQQNFALPIEERA